MKRATNKEWYEAVKGRPGVGTSARSAYAALLSLQVVSALRRKKRALDLATMDADPPVDAEVDSADVAWSMAAGCPDVRSGAQSSPGVAEPAPRNYAP